MPFYFSTAIDLEAKQIGSRIFFNRSLSEAAEPTIVLTPKVHVEVQNYELA